eukprot:6196462-Pleurochrysis_carterae.AAC.5
MSACACCPVRAGTHVVAYATGQCGGACESARTARKRSSQHCPEYVVCLGAASIRRMTKH